MDIKVEDLWPSHSCVISELVLYLQLLSLCPWLYTEKNNNHPRTAQNNHKR